MDKHRRQVRCIINKHLRDKEEFNLDAMFQTYEESLLYGVIDSLKDNTQDGGWVDEDYEREKELWEDVQDEWASYMWDKVE